MSRNRIAFVGVAAVAAGFALVFFLGGSTTDVSVSVDPNEGPSGTTPTITVTGPPNTAVTLDIGGAILTDFTDASGTLVVNRTSIYGQVGDVVDITVTMGSGEDTRTATTTFTITALNVSFDTMITVGLDPSAHRQFVGMPERLTLQARSGSIVVEGPPPFVSVTGEFGAEGSFVATGAGTVAGFSGIEVEMIGTVTPDGLEAEYSMGTGGGLPGGGPITYVISGTPVVASDDGEAGETDIESDVAAFYEALNAAQGAGDPDAMAALLHPAVIDLYGAGQCDAYLATVVNPDVVISILETTGFGDWTWERDDEVTVVPLAVTLIVEVFLADESVAEQEVHLAYDGESLAWFTDCGEPLGG